MNAVNEKDVVELEPWLIDIIANPITKKHVKTNEFIFIDGILDARVFLKNTLSYRKWLTGQIQYEEFGKSSTSILKYKEEIDYDRPIYEHFILEGTILDVGGGCGTVREFLADDVKFVSIDPFISCLHTISNAKKEAYSCLKKHLNFIGAVAEFLPFIDCQFDWVHMRSVLDHVQVPDLTIIEANRVLKDDGKLLVGLYCEGGKSENILITKKIKELAKHIFSSIGVKRFDDSHMWHPTFSELSKLITDNGFVIIDVYWQPHWRDQVCYILAQKEPKLI